MTRPSHQTDRLLLDAGKELICKSGASGLKVREVASKAGVNLGMFHYHFKTKQEFVRRILTEIYGEFVSQFKLESSGEGDSPERLRRALLRLGHFARDNRFLVTAIIQDLARGDREMAAFAKANFTEHIRVLLKLVMECRRQGLFVDAPLPTMMVFLAGTVALPNVVWTIMEKNRFAPASIPIFFNPERMVLSDEALAQRVDLAIKALRREGR